MKNDPRFSFHEELLDIWRDPRIRRLALSRTGDPELAEDALQEAYISLARHPAPERIADLQRYFCQVLIREAYRLGRERGAMPAQDVEELADALQGDPVLSRVLQPLDEAVEASVLSQAWLERLAARRQHLHRDVPGRSMNPGRYRAVIVAVAEQVLRDLVGGGVSESDSNGALRAVYPEWFAGDAAVGNAFQRFSRARADVRGVLRIVVGGDVTDLHPDQEGLRAPVYAPSRQEDAHRPAGRQVTRTSSHPQELLQATARQADRTRTSDDEALTALFHEAEEIQLPHDVPYDLDRELQLFSAWLESK
jgi:hypothetical protein